MRSGLDQAMQRVRPVGGGRLRGGARLGAILLAASLGACSSIAPSAPPGTAPAASPSLTAAASRPATPAPAATMERVAGWRSDLAMLVPAMYRIHPNLGHGTPVPTLQAAADELAARAGTLTDDQLMVGVLRIVAMVSARGCDAHTGAFIWGTGGYPVDSLPLRLWLFPSELADSLVIVDALPPYRDLIGSTIDTIDGVDELDVRKQLGAVVPRDNDWTLRLLVPRYVLIPQVLRGLGVAGPGPLTLGVTTPEGNARTVAVEPVPMADYNAWAGPYGLHLPADPAVPYLSRIDDALWWQVLADDETLFVQDNRIEPQTTATLDGLGTTLGEPGIRRVVLDLRHNYGGEVSAIDPILELFEDPSVDQPDRLFVITGRNTFSAASLLVARLADRTHATIVGEPMGSCPTAYGDSSDVTLPFSKIDVSVSGLLEVGTSEADTRSTIEPDLPAVLSRDAWASGSDPALGVILAALP